MARLRSRAQGRQRAHEGYVYPNAEHGFNNDTTPRFDAASAKLAWDRTIAHFNKYLR